jgi:hypothetical protein
MSSGRSNRGARAIVCVIVCMVIATTIMMTTMRTAIRMRRQMRTETQMEQTQWMLNAAAHRATAKLNEMTKDHPIGSKQPPITVAEIIGAIQRYAGKTEKIPADKRGKFWAIAATKMLNPGDRLTFSTELWSDDIHVTVWWLDLIVDGHRFHIRDRTISYRPQSALEKEMHEYLRKSLEEAMEKQKKRVHQITIESLTSRGFDFRFEAG